MIKFFQKLKAKKGFTLVELIVVIAIIGVLAAILVPTMLGYVTSSRVTSANSTAASIKNNIDNWLTACDTNGYGMLKGTGNLSQITISITGGVWTVNNSVTASFRNGNGKTWAGTGSGSTGDTKVGAVATAPEYLLAVELADLFPEIQTGYISASLVGGKTMAVYYTADQDTTVASIDAEFNATDGGWTDELCAWDNTTAGVATEGCIVGTAPILTLG